MPEPGESLTVILIPKAGDDLQRLQERTELSRTDLANRAIILYEFFDAQLRAGQQLIARDIATGQTRLVQLLDAPGGQVASAAPARNGRGAAGRQLRPVPGRHGRPSRRRIRLPRIGGPLIPVPLFGLGGQGARAA
jgi:hypothetical protein